MKKITIAIDFDGVLYSFCSGWISSRNVSDPPTGGAIPWLSSLLESGLDVIIFSARIYHWGGRKAMKRWLLEHGLPKANLRKIKFVYHKPICDVLIDDRVICFKGIFPTITELTEFEPWHGKGIW